MNDSTRTRRGVLGGIAAAGLGALAGCSGVLGDGSTPTPLSLDHVADRTVFVDDSLSLSVPDGVETTDVPGEADLLVVPGDTDRTPSAIVHWLARDAYVAFLGENAQDTWHDVKVSGAYAAMLGEPRAMAEGCSSSQSGSSVASGSGAGGSSAANGDTADCEPPDMVVAWRTPDVPTKTYRATWGGTDDPSGRQVFEKLDRALDGDE